jgi:hypothetical protein
MGASHSLHANHRALQFALGSVLVLLLLWSSAVLAAWCDEPATHWVHPDTDQAWVKPSVGFTHKPHYHCTKGSFSGVLVALPAPLGEKSDNLDPPLMLQDLLKRPAAKASAEVSMPTGTVHSAASPPLYYLIFQRLLLPFHS